MNLNKIKLSIYYLMMKIWMHLNFDGKLRSKHNEKLKLRNQKSLETFYIFIMKLKALKTFSYYAKTEILAHFIKK